MLERAKAELESRGMAVLGGYICPDHDQYVKSKIRSKSFTAAERLELCELAVEDSDWLMVDRWAGIYASSAVGFTTIVDHIDKMVNHHVKTKNKIKTVYAFGGDNSMFAYSFTSRWSCVCVLRPGSVDRFRDLLHHDGLRDNPRIMFSEDMTEPLDSTSIRKGDLSGLLPKVKARYLALQDTRASKLYMAINDGISSEIDVIYLRNEGFWAISNLQERAGCSSEQLLDAYETFCELLKTAFELALNSARKIGPTPKIVPVKLMEQEPLFQNILQTHERVISLDPCLPGPINIRLTQSSKPLVAPSLDALRISDLITPPVLTENYEDGRYTVFAKELPLQPGVDKLIAESLPENSTVEHYFSLADITSSNNDITLSEPKIRAITMDARDFLVGSHKGGSLLQLVESQLVRAPCILPYVRPSHNSYISATAEMGFSNAIWELNHQFFQTIGDNLVVQDMAPAFQKLCAIQGFPADMRMTELCEWHLAAFQDMVFQKL